MSENHFAKALHNFTMEVACNDAIRALCDKGYTLEKIKETLTFPAKEEHIAKVMWEHMLSKGTVLFDNFSKMTQKEKWNNVRHEVPPGESGYRKTEYQE